jgi:hypothetical protein
MSDNQQSPMQFIQRILISEAIRIHREGHNETNIVMPLSKGKNYTFRATIKTVQSSLNIRLFSAVFRLQNYFIKTEKEMAHVDVLVIIPEIMDTKEKQIIKIRDSQIKVNSVNRVSYQGKTSDYLLGICPVY